MNRTAVLNVVGLTPAHLGPDAPFLTRWAKQRKVTPVKSVLPAVTCSVQATYITGEWPEKHGIVGNGWYFQDECEIKFWRQSHRLIQAPTIWETARTHFPDFTGANLFWWYNMYSPADYSVTPRPMYPADGRKLPDVYSWPPELRFDLQKKLGTFPLFEFWGPRTTVRSSQWIARCAMDVEDRYTPSLSAVYLPHLDYGLQKHGPESAAARQDVREIDQVCEELITFYESKGVQVIILSEYGITPVSRGVSLNRVLREQGMITIREELGRELLDAGASQAFVVADHQVAHVYVRNPSHVNAVKDLLERVPGVASVLNKEEQRSIHINHPRSGDLVVLAETDAWFTYYYWLDEKRAPDFARTVDIHRKPGYDPVELFIDPALRIPQLKAGFRLLQKKLGFRYLMDVIPLDPSLVKGSHGLAARSFDDGPLFIANTDELFDEDVIEPTDVYRLIINQLAGKSIINPFIG